MTPTRRRRCADLDGDGRVTGRDVAIEARALFRADDPIYDLNDDGRVNVIDLLLATRRLGEAC
jgi:hypothetical protein